MRDDDSTFSLLEQLLEELPEVVDLLVLPALDSTSLELLARVGRGCRAAVVSSGLPRAGCTWGLPFRLSAFCGSVERLAWAKEHDCP